METAEPPLPVFCGVDWAEDHHDIAIVDAGGKQLAKVRISDDAAGFTLLIALLAEHGDREDQRIPVAIETSRGLLVARLRATGRPVYAINPLAVARYRDRHTVARRKSDAVDAAALANILRVDRDAHRPLPADSELAQAIAVLARAPTPTEAAQLTRRQLRSLLKRAGRVRGIEAEADRLYEIFRRAYMHHLPQVEAAFGRQTLALLRQLDATCTNADELEAACAEVFDAHPDAPIYTSFPGLGSLSGARILAEIGDDRARFECAGSLKAYAGSAPVTRASGKSCVVLSRKVKNQRLAAVGYIWAFSSLTKSPGARAHYTGDGRPGTGTPPRSATCSTGSWGCSTSASSTGSPTTSRRHSPARCL